MGDLQREARILAVKLDPLVRSTAFATKMRL
jgi:hypothetical protein